MMLARRGLLLVLSSPSGAGKSTISRLLMEQEEDLKLSVSVTTRARRPSEIDGIHYRFVSPQQFINMRERDEFLEWAEVHGHFYGTPREPVEQALRAGQDVLFDIDWQGTRQLCERAPDDVVSIFVLPPSMAELRSRLMRRAEDPAEVISRRLNNARDEIKHWEDYRYVLVNDDLDRAFVAVRAILTAERLARERQSGVHDLVAKILAEPSLG